MRLKELEIQGFKSFPDKTKIEIGEGITGVVGPNGSGKSNISDSIRWVLGETSSKQLRGSGKMEDVIFGGTQSRGAMGYASVALTIDNSDHGLDMDADEVTIGRRYYRSGESEYSINGQNVRLKDVYELLLDTGIGRDGYAIVGQGRIAEIVGAKSAERREIFEEASGIAKYRYRKNEAERRLDAAEAELNDTNSKLWEEYQLTESEARSQCVPFESLTELRRSVTEVRGKIRALGHVNVGAIDEYKEVKERYDFMKAQVTDVEKAKAELTKMIAELCSEMQELFTASFKQINANFQQIFKELFGGGHARLYLSDEANVLESGIEIEVSPPGKVIKNLSALSGGEQALVAISIYFAILRVNPAPFCFLDEIEAALDDVNVARYAQYLRRMTDRTQFIVITHRRGTMEAADVLYGVTMQEDGVSKILRLDLDNVSADLIT